MSNPFCQMTLKFVSKKYFHRNLLHLYLWQSTSKQELFLPEKQPRNDKRQIYWWDIIFLYLFRLYLFLNFVVDLYSHYLDVSNSSIVMIVGISNGSKTRHQQISLTQGSTMTFYINKRSKCHKQKIVEHLSGHPRITKTRIHRTFFSHVNTVWLISRWTCFCLRNRERLLTFWHSGQILLPRRTKLRWRSQPIIRVLSSIR